MRRFSNWFPNSTPRPARPHRVRLGLSQLEAREVPTVTLENNVLKISGDEAGVAQIDTIDLFSPVDGQMSVRVNGVQQFSGSNDIIRVEIDAGGASDQVRIHGVQSGIADGVIVKNGERVTLGDQDPTTSRFDVADIRSDVRVERAVFLTIRDDGSTADRTVVVGENEITGMAPGRISYTLRNNGGLTIRSGSGADTFQIDRTPGARTRFFGGGGADTFDLRRSVGNVEITGQAGADTINIASTGQSLGQIFGRVTVNDGSFQDRVTIDDRRTAETVDFFDSYRATLTSNRLDLAVGARTTLGNGQVISRSFNRTIDLNGLDSVIFRAATRPAATSQLDITAANTFTETDVDVGGVNQTRLGGAAASLNGLIGRTTISGGLAGSRLILNDAGQTVGRAYDINAGQVRRTDMQLGFGALRFGDFLGGVELRTGSGDDRFNVGGVRADGRLLTVDSNAGVDTLVGQDQANDWAVNGTSRGTLNGQVNFEDINNLFGRNNDDIFRFRPLASLSGRIDGGGGFDTLDFSALTTSVTVNLGLRLATRVFGGAAGGVTNILNVFGGSAGDNLRGNHLSNVLVGNGGIDVLNGGTASQRDILIGGTAGDRLLTDGSGETLYIGGDVAAADRNNVASMKAILTEWLRATTIDSRVQNLAAGVGAGGAVQLNSAVLDGDNATDTYTPRFSPDAFYREAADAFSGTFLPGPADVVINV